MKTYRVNEVFYSLQGEGARVGEASVFVRFAGCNLECKVATHGFDCDTDFAGGRRYTATELVELCEQVAGPCRWVVFTGGEPLLQLDALLAVEFKVRGWKIAIETNGTIEPEPELRSQIDWLVCSPKVAEHALELKTADELRYVRATLQALPKPRIEAKTHFLSPAWSPSHGFTDGLDWCLKLCKEAPRWRLSMQMHKLWSVR